MAEVADMGEVDEMHSNEGVLVNGSLTNDVDMESQDSQDSSKKIRIPESMDIDHADTSDNETDETKEGNPDSISTEDDSNDNMADSNSVTTENHSIETEETSSQEGKETEDQDSNLGELESIREFSDSEKVVDHISSSKLDEESQQSTEGAKMAQIEIKTTSEEAVLEVHTELHHKKDKEEETKRESSDESEPKQMLENLEGKNISSIEIHQIDEEEKSKHHETVELNTDSEDDADVMIVDSPKTNGTSHEVIDLVETPEKHSKIGKDAITPRRSSRNLNKNKSYAESDKEDTPPPRPVAPVESEGSDIEEVLPQDPLAVNDQITVERIPLETSKSASTIVVKDTKRLVEIASKSNSSGSSISGGKKEPTLVIIDTNSILSGRGPVPVNKSATQGTSTSNYSSALPVSIPAQYPQNMRATITPIPVNSSQVSVAAVSKSSAATITPNPTPLLPTLTDDMFVVEAPSFIVPYVYEKPPVKILKDFVADLKKQIQGRRKSKIDKAKGEAKAMVESKDNSKNDKENKEVNDSEKKESESEEESEEEEEKKTDDLRKPYNYFNSPLGKFFTDIGFNMVQEYVQADLLKQQKRKREREQGTNPETNKTIQSLMKNLELSKDSNDHFKMELKKCEFCNFKTESTLAMAYHLETPHMKNFVYKCNFCPYEVRSPHDILFHMEAEHAVRGHLERAPAFHQCPSCPFEDNQKGKLSRHLVVCARKFKPDRNLEPPADWEPPAKIPRMPKLRAQGLNATAAAYQAMSKTGQYQFLSKMQLQSTNPALQRGRGRPTLGPNMKVQPMLRPQGMVFKQQAMSGGSVLVPTNYQLSGNQVFQVVGGGQDLGGRLGVAPGHMAFVPPNMAASASSSMLTVQNATQQKKPTNQPSISITPLPRGTTATPAVTSKPGDTNSKNSFVICEICDGYIKDLEQLRNHMQWIHKIKIHPKMIYNRPPLNCQKCQFRFFTDQGLERHLLGSHGLVTSSMQDAANKSKDSGRCPVCGRVYQWKLLNHVARDHGMTLKPAHLSYKCTVCTATFGMYKQFENHVYSAHSVVAKRVMDKKHSMPLPSSAVSKVTDMKPLKINDEITIIPQPAKSANGASKEGSPSSTTSTNSRHSTPSTSKSR